MKRDYIRQGSIAEEDMAWDCSTADWEGFAKTGLAEGLHR